jgi:selenocysteine lyase/cysteine desulfurase
LPVFAFNIAGIASQALGERFETAQIEARVGDYYAPRLMQRLAGKAGGNALRLSFAHYNTIDEVERCFDVIDAAVASAAVEDGAVEHAQTHASAGDASWNQDDGVEAVPR